MYVTFRVEGHLLALSPGCSFFFGFSASIEMEIVFLICLSLPLIELCMGKIPLGDDFTSLGDDIMVVA